MPRPLVAVGAGVHGDPAGAVGVRRVHPDLYRHRPVPEHERGVEVEDADVVAADLVAGADGDFQPGGAGQGGAARRARVVPAGRAGR
nr:hypothetical protein GCM10020092_031990 [Actinoplanes digitatis]